MYHFHIGSWLFPMWCYRNRGVAVCSSQVAGYECDACIPKVLNFAFYLADLFGRS